jgi:thiamine-phosphate pyrophosphorylase
MKKILPQGLYAITAEDFSKGRDNIEVVKAMLDGGVKLLQYRDKEKSKLDKFRQCEKIRALTKEYDACFIVNDDIDIALSVESDGIHLGQGDLPIQKARAIAGADMIIGLSTHSPQQANEAVQNGADYIGVGPIFKTFTKKDVVDPVGFEYLDFCVKNIRIPKTAIGGVKISNLESICKYRPENICLVTEIAGADDIAKTVSQIIKMIEANK